MKDRYPEPMALRGISLADLAQRYGFELVGDGGPVDFLGLIHMRRDGIQHVLTYVTGLEYMRSFVASAHEYALIERRFADEGLPEGKSWLICSGLADEWLFQVHMDLAAAGQVPMIEGSIHPTASVHPSAVIMKNVRIGAGCRIDANTVLYPNCFLGERVHVMANATLGGEGFETKYVFGKRKLIPHTGGVIVEDDCTIGSSTCIDRGLFGTFTRVREGTHIDNLCHIAHNVDIGANAGIVACSLLAGSVIVGRGAWWGPGVISNHEVVVGEYAYIGSGSVITRDIPPHALAFGSPAKLQGWACRCRNKLTLENNSATCGKCGAELRVNETGVLYLVTDETTAQ